MNVRDLDRKSINFMTDMDMFRYEMGNSIELLNVDILIKLVDISLNQLDIEFNAGNFDIVKNDCLAIANFIMKIYYECPEKL